MKFFIISISVLFSILPVLSQEQVSSSMITVPKVFMAAKCESGLTFNDYSISFTRPYYFEPTYNLNLSTALSKIHIGQGDAAFFADGKYRSDENKYDFTAHKLYYSSKFNDNLFGFGIGYTYNNNFFSRYYKQNNNFSETSSESEQSYSIRDYHIHSFFANINGKFSLDSSRHILLGTDFYYNKRNGYQYKEYYEVYADYNNNAEYSTDAATYYIYNNHSYSYNLTFGAALYCDHLKRKPKEKFKCLSLLYHYNTVRSDPSYIDGVKSIFDNDILDNIKFCGEDYNYHEFSLKYLYSDISPDAVHDQSQKFISFVYDFFSMSLDVSSEKTVTTAVNQWNRYNGISWGVTEKRNIRHNLSLSINNSASLFIVKYFYFNLQLLTNLNIVDYGFEYDMANVITINPYLGFKKSIYNKVLFDLRFLISSNCISAYGYKEMFCDLTSTNSTIQLRVSLLK